MILRRAAGGDLPAILALLTDDPLGATREAAATADYDAAFAAILANPAQILIVGEEAGRVVATCQVTFLPGLSRGGMTRALIEAVRVASDRRSAGLGAALIGEAERLAREGGAGLVQLTTDKSRIRAHRFYEGLGYDQSHYGYKKML